MGVTVELNIEITRFRLSPDGLVPAVTGPKHRLPSFGGYEVQEARLGEGSGRPVVGVRGASDWKQGHPLFVSLSIDTLHDCASKSLHAVQGPVAILGFWGRC
jgi:hypothetical protein